MAKGKLPLNDLAGSAGRMDVLVRGLMSALLTSHGLRENVEVILHLGGGPGPSRRIKFVGHEIKRLNQKCTGNDLLCSCRQSVIFPDI